MYPWLGLLDWGALKGADVRPHLRLQGLHAPPEAAHDGRLLLAGEEANHLGPVNTGHATFRLKMYFSQVNNLFFDHTEISLLMLDIHFSVQTLFLE